MRDQDRYILQQMGIDVWSPAATANVLKPTIKSPCTHPHCQWYFSCRTASVIIIKAALQSSVFAHHVQGFSMILLQDIVRFLNYGQDDVITIALTASDDAEQGICNRALSAYIEANSASNTFFLFIENTANSHIHSHPIIYAHRAITIITYDSFAHKANEKKAFMNSIAAFRSDESLF